MYLPAIARGRQQLAQRALQVKPFVQTRGFITSAGPPRRVGGGPGSSKHASVTVRGLSGGGVNPTAYVRQMSSKTGPSSVFDAVTKGATPSLLERFINYFSPSQSSGKSPEKATLREGHRRLSLEELKKLDRSNLLTRGVDEADARKPIVSSAHRDKTEEEQMKLSPGRPYSEEGQLHINDLQGNLISFSQSVSGGLGRAKQWERGVVQFINKKGLNYVTGDQGEHEVVTSTIVPDQNVHGYASKEDVEEYLKWYRSTPESKANAEAVQREKEKKGYGGGFRTW